MEYLTEDEELRLRGTGISEKKKEQFECYYLQQKARGIPGALTQILRNYLLTGKENLPSEPPNEPDRSASPEIELP